MPVELGEIPPVADERDEVFKRLYLRKDIEFKKYGLSVGCKGCLHIKLGQRATKHNDECRGRIVRAVIQDPDDVVRERVQRALRGGQI